MKNILMLFLFIPLLSFGQTTIIAGFVDDQNGKPIPYANVYIDGSLDGSTSNEEGEFSFGTKLAGKYTLICSYIGFQDFKQEINIKMGQGIGLKIVLSEIVPETEAITVVASAFTSGEAEGVTLTPLEVVTTPGAAADVFWAIKSYPGVQQVDEGAGLFVRGGDVSETTVILDGAYLNHPYKYESPNGGFFGTINPFLLKGTYFSSGGYGAGYGNALSGALIMESIDMPANDNYTIGLGLAALSASLGKTLIPGKFAVNMSGNYSNTETMFAVNNNRLNFSRFPRAYDLNFNGIYKYSANGSLKLFLFREVDQIGIEVKNPAHGGQYIGDSENNLVNIRLKHLLNEDFLIQANLAFSNFQNKHNLNVLDLKEEEDQYQARLLVEYNPMRSILVKTGIEGFNNSLGLAGKVPANDSDLDPNGPSNTIDLDYVSNRTAAYLHTEITLNKKLKIVPGIRVENESNTNETILDPRFSLTYRLAKDIDFTAAVGRYHQFPEPNYYDAHVGNPNLGSTSADHYIAGIMYQKENTIIRLEGYYKNYNKLILEDEVENYTTNGDGYASGFDVFLKHTIGQINGRISYSYLSAQRHWMDAPKSSSPEFDITHNLNTVAQYKFTTSFHLGLAYRYATGKPYTSSATSYHDSRVPSYQKLDLNASYLHSFYDGNLTVFYLGVSNLLRKDNIFDYYYSPDFGERNAVKSSMLGSVYFGVSFTFNE